MRKCFMCCCYTLCKVASTDRKRNPEKHVVKHAETFESAHVVLILNLKPTEETDIRLKSDLAAFAMGTFSGYRMSMCHSLQSNGWKRLNATASQPRALVLHLNNHKHDLEQQLGEDDRTNIIPCMCFIFCTNETEKSEFARALVANPHAQCITGM